ncbi:hypothetical protein KEM60_01416 [Austwickia sp. TVS 96-490-7B]|uniref:hypothetical protein n=1 Tax=Austwickia sp. TVS 96-490-7B TaxID=2830843 RepID=UPI001C59DB23|nr:hypothetical protein [Austwickia sp. TVS 96-490-7B]MBW3085219.1 hypothetical protein [Austwickia sp. TVS 96-490-7B]
MIDTSRANQEKNEKHWVLHVQAFSYALLFLAVYVADKSLRVGGYGFHDYVIAAIVHLALGYPFALCAIIFINKLKEKYK